MIVDLQMRLQFCASLLNLVDFCVILTIVNSHIGKIWTEILKTVSLHLSFYSQRKAH